MLSIQSNAGTPESIHVHTQGCLHLKRLFNLFRKNYRVYVHCTLSHPSGPCTYLHVCWTVITHVVTWGYEIPTLLLFSAALEQSNSDWSLPAHCITLICLGSNAKRRGRRAGITYPQIAIWLHEHWPFGTHGGRCSWGDAVSDHLFFVCFSWKDELTF